MLFAYASRGGKCVVRRCGAAFSQIPRSVSFFGRLYVIFCLRLRTYPFSHSVAARAANKFAFSVCCLHVYGVVDFWRTHASATNLPLWQTWSHLDLATGGTWRCCYSAHVYFQHPQMEWSSICANAHFIFIFFSCPMPSAPKLERYDICHLAHQITNIIGAWLILSTIFFLALFSCSANSTRT